MSVNWREKYKDKIITPKQAAALIKDGDKIVYQQCHLAADAIIDEITERADELHDVEFFSSTNIGREKFLQPEYVGKFGYNCIFLGQNTRKPFAEHKAKLVPCHYHMMPKYLKEVYRPTVFLANMSMPDENGMTSMSLNVDYSRMCLDICETTIAMINPYAPHSVGNEVSLDQVTWIVECADPLPELPARPFTEIEEAIGNHIAPYIHDGACLQLGIGGIPDAVVACLYGKKNLGIHTEVFGDGVVDLYEHGVITGSEKQIDVGKIVTNCVLGGKRAIEFVDNNPVVSIRTVDYTNDPRVICQNDNMVSINAALQIDLFGQVAADTVNGRAFSGIGGQVDFVRGAVMSKNGLSFITLPSTAKKGEISRIVPAIPAGTPVTTSRYDVQHIVTEYGVVNLWGLNTRERAEAIIGLAHPKFRAELTAQAKEMGLLY